MKRIGRSTVLIFILALVVEGCSSMGSPAPAVPQAALTGGMVTATYGEDVAETFEAARAALGDFNMTIVSANKDITGGTINATRPDGTPVSISFRSQDPDTTAVGIQVGPAGDTEYAMAISRRIEEHLS